MLKPTRFLTNSPRLADALLRRCGGGHKHVQLVGGDRAAKAAVYPPGLCKAMCKGMCVRQDETEELKDK